MKDYIRMFVVVGSSLILLPFLMIHICGVETGIGKKAQIVSEQVEENKDIISEETLIGILAKEIPYTYELEALKAQAVAIRTYMARRILGIQPKGAIVGYTVDEMKFLWGEEYNSIYQIYKEAVDATLGKLIMYDGKPIEALYHEASSGRTRDAKSIYKKEVPYLKSVDSSVDKVSKQMKYTKEEVCKRLKKVYPSLEVDPKTVETQFQIVKRDEADYITAVQIGNITVSGEKLMEILELPSSAFKIYHSGDELIFDIRGIGDGIGLSLNGANELAKQGMLYEDIIRYYYKDVTIEDYEVQK